MKKKEADAKKIKPEETGPTEADAAEKTAELLRLCQRVTASSSLPMIAVEGPEHIARYVNFAFCRFTGKTEEELVGKSFAEAVPEGENKGYLALLERVYSEGNRRQPRRSGTFILRFAAGLLVLRQCGLFSLPTNAPPGL